MTFLPPTSFLRRRSGTFHALAAEKWPFSLRLAGRAYGFNSHHILDLIIRFLHYYGKSSGRRRERRA